MEYMYTHIRAYTYISAFPPPHASGAAVIVMTSGKPHRSQDVQSWYRPAVSAPTPCIRTPAALANVNAPLPRGVWVAEFCRLPPAFAGC